MSRIIVDLATGTQSVDEAFVKQDFTPPAKTAAEKDADAEGLADATNDITTRAMLRTLADLRRVIVPAETQAEARQWARQAYRDNLRQLL